MLTIALALASATGYGTADFLAGLAARRATAIQITLAVYAVGSVSMAAVLPWSHAGHLSAAAFGWAAAAGVGLAAEALLLAEGFRRAEMSIAGPLSAAVGAALAVIAGLAWGERPGGYALLGLLVVLPAILTVSYSTTPDLAGFTEPPAAWPPPVYHDLLTGNLADSGYGSVPHRQGPPPVTGPAAARGGPGDSDTRAVRRAHWPSPRHHGRGHGGTGGVIFGVTAGIGGAVFLIGGAKAGPAAGIWPALVIQVAGLATTALAAGITGQFRVPGLGSRWPSVSSGVIGAAAALCYLAAARTGMLAIAAAVTGLFPVITVALARIVEKERLTVTRIAGLALATAAVALISAGR